MKTPRFFRRAVSDQEKLREAKTRRDEALAQVLRWTAKLKLYQGLVDKHEDALGLKKIELPAKPKDRKHWLENALEKKDQRKEAL
jgi:hypothetical protein